MTGIMEVRTAQQSERTAEEKKQIAALKKQLYEELNNEKTHGEALESCRIKIGMFLNDVQDKKVWSDWGYDSYGKFLESIAPMVHKGRTSLYNYADVSRQLLPYISPEELPEVGLTKARALATAVKKNNGKRPSDTLLNAAKSPAISPEEMCQLIQDNFGAREEADNGPWRNLHGAYMTDDEWKEFMDCVRRTCKVDPAFSYIVTDWTDATPNQRKEIIWRWIATFLSEYGPENGPENKDEVFGG